MLALLLTVLLATATAYPTSESSESDIKIPPLDCSSIRNFYIQTRGGKAPGNFLEIHAGVNPISVSAENKTAAAIFKINALGVLTVGRTQNGVYSGAPVTINNEGYPTALMYTIPGARSNGDVRVFCSIGSYVDSACPLHCNATIPYNNSVLNETYTFQGGSVPLAEIGIPGAKHFYHKNQPGRYDQNSTVFEAIPVGALKS